MPQDTVTRVGVQLWVFWMWPLHSNLDHAACIHSHQGHFVALQLGKYQEDSQLLDSLLEGIVSPLARTLQAQALGLVAPEAAAAVPPQQRTARVLAVSRLLHVLVTVRGHKTVVRFFPHEAADLEAVIDALSAIRAHSAQPQQPAADPDQALAVWEAQMMLLLWLSMLILIPFGLATVDTANLHTTGQGSTPVIAAS
jgi:hypothetical protein